MAEVSNALIYEILNAIRARLGNMEHKLEEIDGRHAVLIGRLESVRMEVAAAHVGIENIHKSMGHSDSRLARIERRLELSELTG
jgi:DNA repair ATPase RecN